MSETKLIVIVPNPIMGHLPSTVELAKHVVEQDQRISILLAILHVPLFNSSKAIDAYIESQSHETDPNRITFFTLPPLTTLPDKTSPNFFNTVIEIQKPPVKKAVEDRGLKPAAFILDMLYVSMMDVASEFDVPSYIYFTSGANLLSLLFHAQSLFDDKGIDVIFDDFSDPNTELDVPEFKNQVPVKVLPWFGVVDKESEWLKLILNMPRMFRQSKGILVNTFMELESYVIQVLLDKSKSSKIPPVYPVGPILSLGNGKSQEGGQDQDLIIGWLDEQPLSSVVFLCFGSMGGFDVDQVREIANGLDRSGYRFLWSLPRSAPKKGNLGSSIENDSNFNEALPEGFVDRMAHRGRIIKWAPQVQILAHKSIGGFVTHCGWNSILESVSFGVPMATWPLHSEQQLNAFELVKELGLAVEISIDYRLNFGESKGNYVVTAKEVENGVKRLMNIDDEVRGKVREIKDLLGRKALKVGGSSNQGLVHFIEDILHN